MPMVKCGECDGSGTVECDACEGSGEEEYTTKQDTAWEGSEMGPCGTCEGSGEVQCEACDGEGQVEDTTCRSCGEERELDRHGDCQDCQDAHAEDAEDARREDRCTREDVKYAHDERKRDDGGL